MNFNEDFLKKKTFW